GCRDEPPSSLRLPRVGVAAPAPPASGGPAGASGAGAQRADHRRSADRGGGAAGHQRARRSARWGGPSRGGPARARRSPPPPLRGAAALGLAHRSAAGYRANRLTRGLQRRQPRSLSALATFFASPANLQTWGRLAEAVRRGTVPFRQAHGEGVWEHLARSEGENALFARAMEEITRLDAEAVVATPAFAHLPVLCDVAGGTGAFLEAALLRHRGLRGVLVDSPQVIALARSRLEPSGLLPRIELHAADVFHSVPAGLPAYVMKDVLHDWSDASAKQ